MSTEKRALVVGLIEVVEDLELYEAILHRANIKDSGVERITMQGIELLGLFNRNMDVQPLEIKAAIQYREAVKLFYDKMSLYLNYQLTKSTYGTMPSVLSTNGVEQTRKSLGVS